MGSKPRILLHTCCAPCLIFPNKKLQSAGFEVIGFFYNPNIYPQDEYRRRKDTLLRYAAQINVEMRSESTENDAVFFDQAAAGSDNKPARCSACWYLRLYRTAQYAKKNAIGMFTSTLLVSPYQDIETVRAMGEKAAKESGVAFYDADFRSGYQDCVKISKQENLYRQKYCGCRKSLEESKEKKTK
ncbi:MAG: epoxyqueuosine reductase QueH [Candidatus Omnitrophota bacterium]